jgi:hypothetical protein
MPARLTFEQVIEKMKARWGDKYEYPITQTYKNTSTKIEAICKVHGVFKKSPNSILYAQDNACPTCGIKRGGGSHKFTPEFALKELKVQYPNYQFPEFEEIYEDTGTKMKVICPIHGEFKKSTVQLRTGAGCPKCGIQEFNDRRRGTTEEFIAKAKQIHGDTYDYSKTIYTGAVNLVSINCKVHGDFEQIASTHVSGAGCWQCGVKSRSGVYSPGFISYEEFIVRARAIHGDLYEYSNKDYNGIAGKVNITCKNHGEFKQMATDHTAGSRCPACAGSLSQPQIDLKQYIEFLGFTAEMNYRYGVGRKEIDIYIPEKKLGIEYDGVFWHSSKFRPSNYHTTKRKEVEQAGIELIQIFSDLWINNPETVKQLIANRLGISKPTAHARKTKIRKVDWQEAKPFLDKYHVQGCNVTGNGFGLYQDNELIALMMFSQRLSSRGVKADAGTFELYRYASSIRVQGGASKLLKYAIKELGIKKVISYSDPRLFTGKMYEALGFTNVSWSAPSYSYVYHNDAVEKRYHKSGFRHDRLKEKFGNTYNPNLTEKANCENHKYYQIHDCGLLKWELNPK